MKTITLRVDDNIYSVFKSAAEGDKRTLSNFIEYAAMRYITEEAFVSDEEMEDILADASLVNNLKRGQEDIEKGRYRVAE